MGSSARRHDDNAEPRFRWPRATLSGPIVAADPALNPTASPRRLSLLWHKKVPAASRCPKGAFTL
jgi:hypothetical protein